MRLSNCYRINLIPKATLRKKKIVQQKKISVKSIQPVKVNSEIYTDASIINSRLGVGIWSPDYNICISRKLQGDIDINRGELAAIFCALLYIYSRSNKQKRDITIISDSITAIQLIKGDITCVKFQILVNAIQYMANNWDGNILLKKVKSHSGNIGNDGADILAKYSLRTDDDTPSLILPDNIYDKTISLQDIISITQASNVFDK